MTGKCCIRRINAQILDRLALDRVKDVSVLTIFRFFNSSLISSSTCFLTSLSTSILYNTNKTYHLLEEPRDETRHFILYIVSILFYLFASLTNSLSYFCSKLLRSSRHCQTSNEIENMKSVIFT